MCSSMHEFRRHVSFWLASPSTFFNILTPFKHQNISLNQDVPAFTFLIDIYHTIEIFSIFCEFWLI